MNFIELKTDIRTTVGNGPARALRRKGHIPAVLYGPGTEPVLLSVSINDIEQALKKSRVGQVLLNLVIRNGETSTRSAMIKEYQTHPVSRNLLHIDFYEIAMDRKIRTEIPISIKGKAKGVEDGGMLQIIRRELEVSCLPNAIPEVIEIDITELDIGDSIHVGDISLGDDIELLDDPHFTVVTILTPKLEELEGEEEESAEAEGDITKGESATPGAGDNE
ncbi:MAG: 50S ribosomal protein L25/general stress protein Ctc [Proteobacteria bacterium]|nr:50S ribosomal protein L25/general stress protein Ctc [Pseudomonadota bacterium]